MLTHDMLMSVMRPARYIDHEWNVIKKDFNSSRLRFCLCYPEVYDLGMSHLGSRILYDLINAAKGVVCERAFCPWPDLGGVLSKKAIALSSLESQMPLRMFDVLGFSVTNELNYSNILSMLTLGGIPLRAAERTQGFPLIIGGGNCMLNPEPLADFFDCFVIGEAEEAIMEIIAVCLKFRRRYVESSEGKEALLSALGRIPGVYVPSFFAVRYEADGSVKEMAALKNGVSVPVKKVWIKDLDKNIYPKSWVVPHVKIVHDRIGVEIMRGCKHRCRFCQARGHFFPLRIRSAKKIIEMTKALYKTSGYEDVSLLSLSSSDHPEIEHIVTSLVSYFQDKGVSVSFPSMRAKKHFAPLAHSLSSLRKTGLTFAPEAGTERLRKVINKNIVIDDLFEVAQSAFRAGYRRIKLYFMIGLPTEEERDVEAIVELAHSLSLLRKKVCNRSATINISIATFIPKPHTPFQWAAMARPQDIIRKQQQVRELLRKKRGNMDVTFHNPSMSLLEAALSRGDRRLSQVIADAFCAGAQFDQWSEWFNFEIWQNAFRKSGLELSDYAVRSFGLEQTLAWDFIDVGIPKHYLKEEFQKALTADAI